MNAEAIWKLPGIFRADAQKVADEISALGDEVTPEQIVEAARDENTELHKCFDWDDTIAAEKWRLHQARQVVCFIVYRERDSSPDSVPVRVFHKVEYSGGYKPAVRVFKNEDEYQKLLQTAYAELRAFKIKYARLQELSEILALID